MSQGIGLKPRDVIDGRFELVEKLDDRGAGEAWKARDPNFKTRLSMLKFLRRVEGDDEVPEALEGVIRRLRKLKHPNLLETTGSGVWEGHPYLVQSWFDGVSLVAALDATRKDDRAPTRASLEKLIDQMCAALEALHGMDPPWVHGELHPGCVLVHRKASGEFDVRVIDVGVGPFAEGGTAFIYADCVAPERKEGRPPLPATDVYALAMVMRRVLREPSEARAHVVPFANFRGREDVPAAVWEVMARATRLSPTERYEMVAEMRAALRDAWRSEARLSSRRQEEPQPDAPVAPPPPQAGAPPSLYEMVERSPPEAPPVAMVMPLIVAPPEVSGGGEGSAQGAANPWATRARLQEVPLPAALAHEQVVSAAEAQERAAKNPWSTEVLKAEVKVDAGLLLGENFAETVRVDTAPHEGAPRDSHSGLSEDQLYDRLLGGGGAGPPIRSGRSPQGAEGSGRVGAVSVREATQRLDAGLGASTRAYSELGAGAVTPGEIHATRKVGGPREVTPAGGISATMKVGSFSETVRLPEALQSADASPVDSARHVEGPVASPNHRRIARVVALVAVLVLLGALLTLAYHHRVG